MSGTVEAVPVPVTVIVRPVGAVELCAVPGRPIASTATAAASATSTASWASLIAYLLGCVREVRRRLSPMSPSRGGGRGAAEAVQVRLPAVRDPRRGEVDEQHRRGRARLAPQGHRDLLGQAVALAHVARRTRGDDVLPDGLAPTAARDDVVQGQLAAIGAAVHAAPA